ncbi:MAG: HEAT repeat domain-containing protein [Pseudomonadota bacterium]
MTNVEIQKKTVDALVTMNTAIKNLRLYPATSAMIVQTVDKLYEAFIEIFAHENSLIFAESERTLLIGGEALPQKDQERPAVTAFLDLMLNLGIRSITFEKGMKKEEMTTFVDLMSRKPETIRDKGGLQAVAAKERLEHIILNQKFYIASDQDHQIMAGLDIKDDQILQHLAAAYPDQTIDLERVRDMAKDANWVMGIFRSGMTQILQDRGSVENGLLSEHMVRMLAILDKVADEVDQDNISQFIGKSIADLDPDLIGHVLRQKIQDLFGGNLYQYIVSQIDDAKYEAVTRQMHLPGDDGTADGGQSGTSTTGAVKTTDGRVADTEKEDPRRSQTESSLEDQLVQKETQMRLLDQRVQHVLNTGEEAFSDPLMMASLPDMIRQLAVRSDQEQTDELIDKIVNGLSNENPDVRGQAAESLVEIIDNFPVERQPDLVRNLSKRLVEWIRREETAFRSYKIICYRLKDLVQDDIRRAHFADAPSILEVFNRIDAGVLEKNDTVHAIASEIINELTSGDLLNILFEEFNTDAKKKRLEAGRVLARLGEVPLNRLLDMLREHNDSNERVRIIQLITDIGQMAIPVIRARIMEDEPWYYLRNLAYLLGRVGNEATVNALDPLLLHNNNRVRQEALKSVHRIGGHERGPLLLSILPRIDDSFKINVIEMLGILKFAGAVEPLIRELKERPLREKSSRADLEEIICTALGRIGAPEAIPILSKVSRSGGFFSVRPYSEKAINAAGKALAAVKRRQAETKR